MAPLVSVFKVREPRLREVKEFCKVTQLKLTKPRLVSRSGRLTRALPPQEALGPSLRCARWSSRRILLHRDQRSKGKGRGPRRGALGWCWVGPGVQIPLAILTRARFTRLKADGGEDSEDSAVKPCAALHSRCRRGGGQASLSPAPGWRGFGADCNQSRPACRALRFSIP